MRCISAAVRRHRDQRPRAEPQRLRIKKAAEDDEIKHKQADHEVALCLELELQSQQGDQQRDARVTTQQRMGAETPPR
jgi:hypothetical protein